MRYLITALLAISMMCVACGPVIGTLPSHRIQEGVHIEKIKDSSFSMDPNFYSWVLLRVNNYSHNNLETYVQCTYSTPEGQEETAYQFVTLSPMQYQEVYLSAPITSRFRTRVHCELLEEVE